tara:strand:+ start:690 stop:821 length:132 start_codon:yes stop_codon:yes gene_type:complete
MEQYIIGVMVIPVVWFLVSLSYQIGRVFTLWLKLKLENIKETL